MATPIETKVLAYCQILTLLSKKSVVQSKQFPGLINPHKRYRYYEGYLQKLRRAGYVVAYRGPTGGYALNNFVSMPSVEELYLLEYPDQPFWFDFCRFNRTMPDEFVKAYQKRLLKPKP